VAVSPVLVFAQANPAFQYAAAERSMVMLEALRENVIEQALDQPDLISPSGDGIMDFISDRLHPYGNIEFEYSDNIYLLKNDREHDFVNRINPGVKFILGPGDLLVRGKNYLELDLGGNISNYFIHHKADRSNPYAKLRANLGKGNHRIDFRQEYEVESLPTSLVSAGKPGTSDYTANLTDISWETVLNRFGFDLQYVRKTNDYIGDFRLSNSMSEQTGIFSAFIIPEATPKTRFLFEYQYGIISYPKTSTVFNNYYKNKYWTGVRGVITKKITGTAKFGYETIRYRTGKEYRTFPVYGDLYYRFSRRALFILNASRELGTSSYIYEGNGEYLNIGLTNRFQINSKTKLISGFFWGKSKYGGGDVRFSYGYPVRLEYSFNKWLSSDVEYKYQFVQSNNDIYKYSNNVFSVGLKAEF